MAILTKPLISYFFQNMATKIDDWKNTYFTDKIIIGGDFNAVPDEWQDRYPTPFTTFSYNPLVYNISQSLDLIDVWRVINLRGDLFQDGFSAPGWTFG